MIGFLTDVMMAIMIVWFLVGSIGVCWFVWKLADKAVEENPEYGMLIRGFRWLVRATIIPAVLWLLVVGVTLVLNLLF